MMTYRGHVHNGVVVLDGPTTLPEGAEVMVDVLAPSADSTPRAQGLGDFAGILKDLPADAAENLDHYLYGHPKR